MMTVREKVEFSSCRFELWRIMALLEMLVLFDEVSINKTATHCIVSASSR